MKEIYSDQVLLIRDYRFKDGKVVNLADALKIDQHMLFLFFSGFLLEEEKNTFFYQMRNGIYDTQGKLYSIDKLREAFFDIARMWAMVKFTTIPDFFAKYEANMWDIVNAIDVISAKLDRCRDSTKISFLTRKFEDKLSFRYSFKEDISRLCDEFSELEFAVFYVLYKVNYKIEKEQSK